MTPQPGGMVAQVIETTDGWWVVDVGFDILPERHHRKEAAERTAFCINQAVAGALEDATEKLQAHNDHLQRMLNLPSARKDIAEAEARIWEEAAKIVLAHECGPRCFEEKAPDYQYRLGIHSEIALRSRARMSP